jgi:hypothetical protein
LASCTIGSSVVTDESLVNRAGGRRFVNSAGNLAVKSLPF